MPSLTVTATIDSDIDAANTDLNYGNNGNNRLGVAYAGPDKTFNMRVIVNFDVSALINTVINSATLRRQYSSIVGAGGVEAKVARCTRPAQWTELGVTWNKYDGSNTWTTAGGDLDLVTPAEIVYNEPSSIGWFELASFKDFVIDALDNRNGIVSLIIRQTDESDPGGNEYTAWVNRDFIPDTDQSQLVIDYSFPGRRPHQRATLSRIGQRRPSRPARARSPARPRAGRRPAPARRL